MRPADLAGWTPVALHPGPGGAAIDWGNLRGVRFTEPFFDQTVERWAGRNPPPLVRTGFDALAALDGEPSLDPCALVFHLSRCGSTLVPRLLGTVPGVLAISEPAPLNALLLADPGSLDPAASARALRLLVRALGRRRLGDERRYVLKLSSWNVARFALFRRAFPEAAVIWVQRAPHETVASLLADPPGWLGLRHDPGAAHAVFGMTAPPPDVEQFCVAAVASLLAAAGAIDGPALYLDHAELPEAVWTRVAPFLGLSLAAADVARMRDAARYHAKEPVPRLFTGSASGRRPLSDAMRARIAEAAEPIYRALDRRRAQGCGDYAPSARL